MAFEGAPSFSIDRGVAHLWRSIEIDTDPLANFYDELELENKPQLEECNVHLSSLVHRNGPQLHFGIHLHGDDDPTRYDQFAPRDSNIILFMGSFMRTESDLTPSQALGHELVHYAQSQEEYDRTLSQEERELQVRLRLMRGFPRAVGFLLNAAFVSGVVELADSIDSSVDLSAKQSVATGVILAGLRSIVRQPARKRKLRKIHEELFRIHSSAETEVEADSHTEELDGAITLGEPMGRRPIIFDEGSGRTTKAISRSAHRVTSLTPPGKLRR
ncbi:MAG: hypothetical protein ACRD4B_00710 [Acidobacteriota bacterium]